MDADTQVHGVRHPVARWLPYGQSIAIRHLTSNQASALSVSKETLLRRSALDEGVLWMPLNLDVPVVRTDQITGHI